MSLYDKNLLKEQVEEHFKNCLDPNVEYINLNDELTDKEFEKIFMIFQTTEYTNIKDMFKEWKIYIQDDVCEKIIYPNVYLSMEYEHFELEETLELAKKKNIINGFARLSQDLWIIKEGKNEI